MQAELENQQRIQDEKIREKEALEKEKDNEALNQETAMLFNLDIKDVDSFAANYEGGYTVFFKERTILKNESLVVKI